MQSTTPTIDPVTTRYLQKPMERPYMRPFLNAFVNHESMKQSKRPPTLPQKTNDAKLLSHIPRKQRIEHRSDYSVSSLVDTELTISEIEVTGPIMASHLPLNDLIELLTGPGYRDLEMEIRVFLLLSPAVINSNQLMAILNSLVSSPGVYHMISLWNKYYRARQLKFGKGTSNGNPKESACSIISEACSGDQDQRLWLNAELNRTAKVSLENIDTLPEVPGVFKNLALNGFHYTKITGRPYHKPFNIWLTNGSQEIADQLSLFWFEMLKKTSVFELVNYALDHKNRHRCVSPHVTRFVHTSQQLMAQVEQTTSSLAFSCDQRIKMVKRWIRVAAMMYAQGNLNGVVCVVTVLQYADIQQIRAVWNSLEVIYQTTWSKLQEIASPRNQFAAYWRETKYYTERPCIPFLGAYVEEISKFQDNRKSSFRKSAQVIDRNQMMLVGHRLADLQRFQLTEFRIPYNAEIQWQLNQQLHQTEDVEFGVPELENSGGNSTAC